MLWAMDIQTALGELGVDHRSSWEEIRDAHRAAIRRTHPDAGGATAAAARVNEAFDFLSVATDHGARPTPAPIAASAIPPVGASSPRSAAVSAESPTELLMNLAEVGHDIGQVVFVDPLSGLMEIIVGDAPGVGQLTVDVGDRANPGSPTPGGVRVAFTLEPLGLSTPPPIADVVDDLLDRHRARTQR